MKAIILLLLFAITAQAQFSLRILDPLNESYPVLDRLNPHIVGSGPDRKLQWHTWLNNHATNSIDVGGYLCTGTLTPVGAASPLKAIVGTIRPATAAPSVEFEARPISPTRRHQLPADVPDGDYIFTAQITDAGRYVTHQTLVVRVKGSDLSLVPP